MYLHTWLCLVKYSLLANMSPPKRIWEIVSGWALQTRQQSSSRLFRIFFSWYFVISAISCAASMTHCKEARNLCTALFHGLYFQISYICLGLYGFRDHPRIQSDSGGPQMTSRLGLRSAYYQKPPQKIIKIDEKKWEFWKDLVLSIFWTPEQSKKGAIWKSIWVILSRTCHMLQ